MMPYIADLEAEAAEMRYGVSQADLLEALDYDPATGVFTWRAKIADKVVVGARAGSLSGNGYRQISLFGRNYAEHRLAFLWMTGAIPTLIDHQNGDKADNRWANLREADKRLNSYNARTPVTNSSGFKGVSRNGKRWSASIKQRGKKVHLGTFDTPGLAHEEYCKALQAAGGDFARTA